MIKKLLSKRPNKWPHLSRMLQDDWKYYFKKLNRVLFDMNFPSVHAMLYIKNFLYLIGLRRFTWIVVSRKSRSIITTIILKTLSLTIECEHSFYTYEKIHTYNN